MLRPGEILLGRYQLITPLAEGAGGETWRAEGPDGPVVVKVVRGEDRRRIADLLREAAVLRRARHPNVVGYREFSDRLYEDTTVLVTEFVPGGDLEEWVYRVGPRPVTEVARCGLQIVDALAALAELGILHRDLKPSNVLVQPTATGPRLRVTDFGISRPLWRGVARTTDRSLTPAYAAPEQHRGDALTQAADLYALGGILGFLATGQHPPEVTSAPLHPGLASLREALMALEPAHRLTLDQAREALGALAHGQPLPTLLPPTRTAPPPPRRGRARVAGVIAALGVLAAGAGLATLDRSAPPALAPARAPAPPVTEVVVRPPPEPVEVVAPPPRPVAPESAPRIVGLRITSRPWSNVTIDGRAVGRTSDAGTRFEVTTGRHAIRLEDEQGHVWERTIEISGDRRLCVQLRTGTEIGC